jgi:hypothetical protein
MTRLSIIAIVTWWRRRTALRQAPSLTEIETRRAHLARLAKHHRERAPYLRALRAAVHKRLAAELGVRNPYRRTQ